MTGTVLQGETRNLMNKRDRPDRVLHKEEEIWKIMLYTDE
jgi:hypothetical protein